MNTITIEIRYNAGSRLLQRGVFPIRGRRPEQIALAYWNQIRKEMSYHAELVKVIADGDKDITQMVKELETQEWRNIEDNWNLPF
jgi:hypothetical protein